MRNYCQRCLNTSATPVGTLPQSPVHVSPTIDAKEHEDENYDKDDSDQEDESPISRKGKRVCGPSNDKREETKEWIYDYARPTKMNCCVE